jgi:chemotaxis protein CheZ
MDSISRQSADYRPWVEAMRAALAAGDESAFSAAMRGFNALQDSSVMTSVRKVRGDLQAALERFRAESRLAEMAERQVPDARQRLAHVLKLTDDAAHHTMDLVDQSCPLVDAVTHEAHLLQQLPELSADIGRFLELTQAHMKTVRARLTDVLLAQGYQDLSGQIIRNVMQLVDELEMALGDLVRIDRFEFDSEFDGGTMTSVAGHAAAGAYGPVVPGVGHGETVGGQEDIDAMLSGLGV